MQHENPFEICRARVRPFACCCTAATDTLRPLSTRVAQLFTLLGACSATEKVQNGPGENALPAATSVMASQGILVSLSFARDNLCAVRFIGRSFHFRFSSLAFRFEINKEAGSDENVGLLQIEVPGAEHVDNTVTIDGASMLPSTMQGTDTVYDTQAAGPMQVSVM